MSDLRIERDILNEMVNFICQYGGCFWMRLTFNLVNIE